MGKKCPHVQQLCCSLNTTLRSGGAQTDGLTSVWFSFAGGGFQLQLVYRSFCSYYLTLHWFPQYLHV